MKNLISLARTTLFMAAVLAGVTRPALADFSATFTSGATVPDGSFIGLNDTRNLTGVPFNTITDVNVRMNVSGGWNGDLYAYLVHNSGFAVLLNRVGRSSSSSFGYGDAGFDVTFDAQNVATYDFHYYQLQGGSITGGANWRPDGRNISPTSSGATFDSTSPSALLTSFNGINPNGNWTLFVADVSGGSTSVLSSWGLDIAGINVAAVAEPGSVVEGSLAALFLGAIVGVVRRKGPKAAPSPA